MCGCLSRRASQSGVLQKATGGTGGALDPIIGFFFLDSSQDLTSCIYQDIAIPALQHA